MRESSGLAARWGLGARRGLAARWGLGARRGLAARWGLGARRGLSAGLAVLLGFALIGVGASAAQAVTDTFKVVFQDNDNVLAGYSNSGSVFTTTLGMKAGTSPSVATLSGGVFEAAFEANNGNLGLNQLGGATRNTTLGMDAGSSPAIAALPGGGWVVAFQDNDHVLYLYTSGGGKISTGLGMDAGTSPAIAAQPDGSYRVVFQDNDHVLAGYNSTGSHYTTTAGLKAGTSPSVAAKADGTYEAAAQANTGDLVTFHIGAGVSVNTTTCGMDAASSPAVAVLPSGAFKVVFQDNDHVLAGYNSTGSDFTTTAGLRAGTSPSVTPEPDGSYIAAAEANTGNLATFHIGTGVTVNTTTLGMDNTTSPTLATPAPATGVGAKIVSYAQGQAGYQDSPSGTYCNKFSAYWGAGSNCGNGNYSEEWCADFAAWAWRMAGVSFTYGAGSGDIDGAAASFYQWGAAHGTWHAAGSGYTPQPGDAVIYGLNSAGSYADHVAIVTGYTSGEAGPNVVNGDWWVNGNGGVVAANDQTTATGSDGVSGYVTPGGPAAQGRAASAAATTGHAATRHSATQSISARLASGLYTDAPDGTPHYVLSFTAPAGGTIRGAVNFLYQDGRMAAAGSLAGTLSGHGKIILTLGHGTTLSGRYAGGRLHLDGCAAALPLAKAAGGCTFTYHGHVP